jgi:hypothetical protein
MISKRQANNRKIKDSLMDDVSDIRKDYRNMLNSLFGGKLQNQYVISWFKIANIKLNSINTFTNSKFKKCSSLKAMRIGDGMRLELTESDEFIKSYKDSKSIISLGAQTKTSIESRYAELNDEFLKMINEINYY